MKKSMENIRFDAWLYTAQRNSSSPPVVDLNNCRVVENFTIVAPAVGLKLIGVQRVVDWAELVGGIKPIKACCPKPSKKFVTIPFPPLPSASQPRWPAKAKSPL